MERGKREKDDDKSIKWQIRKAKIMLDLKTLVSKVLEFKIGVIVAITVIIATVASVLYVTNTEDYINNQMTKVVTQYYERDMKENMVGVNRLIVTLQTLKDAGFNIKKIEGKKGVPKDLTKAFSYIIIQNPEETDYNKIIYTIENHLFGE